MSAESETGPRRPDIVLVDGRSGSGKTELARAMVAQKPELQLVRMDDLYPGWDGLEAGSRHVHDHLIAASVRRWQRWDWADAAPAEWHVLDPHRPVLVEGCGALSRANRALAVWAVWVELDEPTRRARVRARDGDSWDDRWDDWAAQEDAFIARENPRDLADSVIDGNEVL
ncbi:dephospho-CoA kinase [Cryobacterium mesophilum]|uniref:ATP-binding protein n=1 Tax=Terrimesophilobacter mesophilus TaxID=433647 RepID=A0A4R8V7X5_9MICO|nr:ATP-binding protein [Terrimesophilobacter mesophilus]MBB5632398.1 dephospho-CoA kinase [Terrimesophilobacter mesophilus]TFB79234.1 ATP-binding protein [Terrimesophilobacter mesophilus]